MRTLLAGCCIATLCALLPAPAQAQNALSNRAVDMARCTALERLAPNETVSLTLGLPLRNHDRLDQLIRRLYDRHDPLYGRFLKPAQFNAQFSPTLEDYRAVSDFARSRGMAIRGSHQGRTLLNVEASASAVEHAFGVRMMRYRSPEGRLFAAADREPALPASMAGKIASVVGIGSPALFQPALIRRGQEPREALFALAGPPAEGASPDALSSSVPGSAAARGAAGGAEGPGAAGSGVNGGFTPHDLRVAYGLDGYPNSGAGQTIAVVEFDGYTSSDIVSYEQQFNLPAVPVQNIYIDGYDGSAGSAAIEVTLDIELDCAIVPAVNKILVYEAPNTLPGMLDLLDRVVTDDAAAQISMSWAQAENTVTQSYLIQEANFYEQMAAQGQSFFASAGDWDGYGAGPTTNAQDPASQPYVTGVGGTTLSVLTPGGLYGSETGWAASGGGISGTWPIPWYQEGAITTASKGSTVYRNIPDVGLDANPNSGVVLWLNGGWTGRIGGTSMSAPLWAGFTALTNERRAMAGLPSIGFLNPEIYELCAGASYSQDFHDVDDGTSNGYFSTVPGYDLVTGWGSYHGYNLADDLADPNRLIWSWGDNSSGQLGASAPAGAVPAAEISPQLGSVVQLVSGANFSAALRSDGTVWAWGYNVDGELGNGAYNPASSPASATPGQVTDLTGAVAISSGGEHTAALRSDGTIWSWGDNRYGELGNGVTAAGAPYGSDSPVQATGFVNGIALSAGAAHTLALTAAETVYAWGDNTYGQLGTGGTSSSSAPEQLSGLSAIVAVAAGAHHSLALGSNGAVWAWGYNASGELGYGAAGSTSGTPTQVSTISGVTAIAAGGVYNGPGFSLALKSDGTVWAWGDNSAGELGNGSFTSSQTPVQVVGVSGAVAIAAGQYHGLALTAGGQVWAWGANGDGQLGNGTTSGSSGHVNGVAVPAVVGSLPGAMYLSAGANSSMVIGRGIEYAVSGVIDPIGAIDGAQGPITFTLHSLAGPEFSYTTTPAADGSYTIAAIPPGVYNIGILGPKWLRTTLTNVNVNADLTGVNASLRPGDLNGDNVVDLNDFAIFAAAFGTDATSDNWNVNADLNGDGVVDLTDFSLFAVDFGLSGDPAP